MPIIINDYVWNQTESRLTIKVPLRGIHHSKADIFYAHSYLKASFEQYFFEAFLASAIDPKASRCTFTPTHIVFELVKNEPKLWDRLELELTKADRQSLKTSYIEEEHKRLQEECAQNATKLCEMKRFAVREQLAIDSEQRKLIETIKTDEKTKALEEMDIWKTSTSNKTRKHAVIEETVPPPRASRVVNVTFTSREFPTPCRESRMEEENEWLRKQAEARRSVGFISEDLRPEEHNPQFLKSKGDEFLRGRNYLGAISAYSFGIRLNDKFADLHVARAEAHLALGNYSKTAQDCSRALELMKPEVPQNLRERALCIGRRGIALINLGLTKQGIDELKASLRLVPNEDFSLKLQEATE